MGIPLCSCVCYTCSVDFQTFWIILLLWVLWLFLDMLSLLILQRKNKKYFCSCSCLPTVAKQPQHPSTVSKPLQGQSNTSLLLTIWSYNVLERRFLQSTS